MVERIESMTWAGATPVPRQATQHHTLYCILHSIQFDRRSIQNTAEWPNRPKILYNKPEANRYNDEPNPTYEP